MAALPMILSDLAYALVYHLGPLLNRLGGGDNICNEMNRAFVWLCAEVVMEWVKVLSAKCFVVTSLNIGDKDDRCLNFFVAQGQLP